MSFKEKSSWIMLLVMGAMLLWYGASLYNAGGFGEGTPAVMVITMIVFVILIIIAHVSSAVIQAILTGRADDDFSDERDRRIMLQGEQAGGFVLGTAVLGALGFALVSGETIIANILFVGLMASEVFKAGWQIVLYRRAA